MIKIIHFYQKIVLDAASLRAVNAENRKGPERIGSRPCMVCFGNSLDAASLPGNELWKTEKTRIYGCASSQRTAQ